MSDEPGHDDDDKGDRGGPFRGFRIEVDPEQVEETVREIRQRVRDTFRAGATTRVRLSFQGRRIAPDIPLAVFLAGEGVAFWLLSPLPALLINLGARAVLEVELIDEAEELVSEGVQHYLDGDLERAERAYRRALRKRPDDPSALYNLGVLLTVAERRDEARAMLRAAAMGPEGHPDVQRASEALGRLEGG